MCRFNNLLQSESKQQMRIPVDDQPRRETAFARMNESFAVNRGLKPVFLFMANAHRYAIDYIEQAPVIVLAATRGHAHPPCCERAIVQEQLSTMCDTGTQLRDVMPVYGLPLPLRLLEARVLTSSRQRPSGGSH